MELPFILVFVGLCAVSAFRPPWAFAVVLLMFPLEQVMQAHCPMLRAGLGLQLVNYAVALTAILACVRVFIKGGRFTNSMNTAMLATIALYVWSAITLFWSPGRVTGFEVIGSALPYFFLIIVVAPLLVSDIDELTNSLRVTLWIALPLGVIFIVSPEFTSRYGRIGFEFGMGARSNALAIGELGGTLLLIGATLRSGILPVAGTAIRIAAVIIGALVAIKAGSRGQFFISVFVAVAFIPISAPLRNLSAFLSALIGIGVVIAAASVLLSTQLEGFAAQRFSSEAMLYGDSSVGGRASNLYVLAAAYLQSPVAIFIGLGYNAFSTLHEGLGDPYSHNLFADSLFELGIPGAILMSMVVWTGCRSMYQLLRFHAHNPLERAVLATASALLVAQILLVNKQGSLWGTPVLFPLAVVMVRIKLNEANSCFNQPDAHQ